MLLYVCSQERFLRSLLRKDEKEAAAAIRSTRLGEFFDWLVADDWSEEFDPKTVAARRGRFEKYACARWGDMPRTAIDPVHVKGYYRQLRRTSVPGMKADNPESLGRTLGQVSAGSARSLSGVEDTVSALYGRNGSWASITQDPFL